MPGWTKHENFLPDKTNRAFDLELMKTSKAKEVTRTIKQDKTRLDQQLKSVSRDYKKRMNQLGNEADKWKKKAEELMESKDHDSSTDDQEPPSSQTLARRRGSLDSYLLVAQQRDFMRRRSKTIISVDDLPGTGSPEAGGRVSSGRCNARRGSLDPTILSIRQKEFFSKIAKISNNQTDDTADDYDDVDGGVNKSDGHIELPAAFPSPRPKSCQGRRRSLPVIHLGGQASSPPRAGQMPPLELIQEIERRDSQSSEPDKEDDYLERVASEKEQEQYMNKESGNRSPNNSEISKASSTKIFHRRQSISERALVGAESGRIQSPRSSMDSNLDGKKQTAVQPVLSGSSHNDNDAILMASTVSGRGQRSRSNSLYDPKSIRLVRRRNSNSASEDLPGRPSLAEQFELLKDCRYLRSGNSIQHEDCDLSHVFG